MSFDELANSRSKGRPITLFMFQGDLATEYQLENQMRGVTLIPGTTEFGYATTKITKDFGGGQIAPENWLSNKVGSDFVEAIRQLQERAPNLEHVSLVVAWHGTDLRIGECEIKPKVDRHDKDTTPRVWQCAGLTRATAEVVTYTDGYPSVGGAPADWTVYEAVAHLKSLGLRVTFYPFVMMDIAPDNTLPNPYSDDAEEEGQPAFPWRGRITTSPAAGYVGSPDKTAAAADQVDAFFGEAEPEDFAFDAVNKLVNYTGPAEWSFRRFILHMATICEAAGADAFLIGSEMVGMTTIRDGAASYPAVTALQQLAADVSTIISGAKIGYAADWSEYHSHRPGDGSNDVFFHLDPLWADANIDFIGIDNYFPISDWRDGDQHLDFFEGWKSIYDLDYLASRIEGGENYDWYYASDSDRDAQVRTPIVDGAYGKDWVFRQKDYRNWWLSPHINRPGGVETGPATAWVPQSKPIVFTELGCSAVDKGSNQPNVFIDPKSSESFYPRYSDGTRDTLIQRSFLEAWLRYWSTPGRNPASTGYTGTMLDMDDCALWTWDSRPYPTFPKRSDFWSDSLNWELGHWLNGRLERIDGPVGKAASFAYTDNTRPFTFQGEVYQPLPINCGTVNTSGKLDKTTFEVRVPRTAGIADLFRAYPPSQPISLIVRQGHLNDPSKEFLVAWTGRVLSSRREENETIFSCEPMSSSLRRPGLRRPYQIGCMHPLYGPLCYAKKVPRTGLVTAISGLDVTLSGGWNGPHAAAKYAQGLIEWDTPAGTKEIRRILRVAGNKLTVSGLLRGMEVGDSVAVLLGCGHNTTDCHELHGNIHNFGGCPTIPPKNPLASGANNFY